MSLRFNGTCGAQKQGMLVKGTTVHTQIAIESSNFPPKKKKKNVCGDLATTIPVISLYLLDQLQKPSHRRQNCVSDVKKWTIHNKLQLNKDKTEALLFKPSKSSGLPDVPRIGQSERPFCYSVRNLGVMFDGGLTMKQQADRICQTAYFEIRRIGSIPAILQRAPPLPD